MISWSQNINMYIHFFFKFKFFFIHDRFQVSSNQGLTVIEYFTVSIVPRSYYHSVGFKTV